MAADRTRADETAELADLLFNFMPIVVRHVNDRLETLGLVERQPHPSDRRIKNLVLTAKGQRLKKSIPETLWKGPNTFSALTEAEHMQLANLLSKLTASNR